jgi:hypothetical protein
METKNCQNCKNDFTIEPEDFDFYAKIDVPPPTFCPECRMVRRMCWRNVRSLHRRECHICNKLLITMYKNDGVPVMCSECFFGDNWDPKDYGKDYDFSQIFLTQLNDLFKTVPRMYAYRFGNLVNSDFTNYSKDNKNCYLAYSVTDCEDVYYSETVDKSKNTFDSYAVQKVDNVYENIDCEGNFNTHFAVKSQSCLDSYFLYDCANCSNCFMSCNIRNKSYYFYNQQLTKEDYFKAINDLEISKYSNIEKLRKSFVNMILNEAIHKYAFNYSTNNVSGDYIHNAKNVKRSFDVNDAENVAYSMRGIELKDSYDIQGTGFKAELIYEAVAGTANTVRDFFVYITIQGCRECEYSLILKNCSNCFGCVGLINAQYCILNKQYEKEEYFEMVAKIKKHMSDMPYIDPKGRVYKYGEFFPFEMSPFGYNETNAHDFFPISKNEAMEKGYNWFDREKRDYKITIESSYLPDDIFDIEDSILNEIIACPNNGDEMTQCTTAYKITPEELQFYRQKKLPLPRFCPNCRHYERLKYRNPMKLYTRSVHVRPRPRSSFDS